MKPTLTTDRLALRPLSSDDADALAKILGDPRRPAYLGERMDDPEDHRRRIEQRHADGDLEEPLGIWAIERRTDDTVVGVALLKPLEGGPEVEVGWHLDPDVWGAGYATESARILLDYAFNKLGLDRVVAVVDPRNGPSRRVIERLGMCPDGTGHYYDEQLDRFVITAEP